MLRHVGDIAASRALQVGIRAFPDLRSPHCLIVISGRVESRKMFWVIGLYISESRILFTPQSLHRSGEVSWRRSFDFSLLKFYQKNLGSRGYLGIVPIFLWWEHSSWCLLTFRGCGSVPGSWAPRCCCHNFIVAVLEYLSFADIENHVYAVVGEITSTPPSTRREFGSITITCIMDAFLRLR